MVSIVIPLYYCSPNLYLPLQRCFNALSALKGDFELIVVDDASPLDHNFPVTSIHSENKGYTATVNAGLKKTKGSVIIVMNDDIVITQECYDRIVKHFLHHSHGIVSPADTASSPDDRFGALFAMNKATYKLLGGLNERYTHFFSDRAYYDRAKRLKIDITKWHDIILDHAESSTYKELDKEALLAVDAKRWESRRSV